MKERIRDWNPRQKIKVKYKVDATHYSYWETTADQLYSQVSSIVDAYFKKRIKLSNRQLYYRLVGKNWIPNRIEIYKRVCVFLTDCRYGGYIDWDAIEDRGRVPKRKPQWDSIQDLVASAIASYRLPRWKDQDYYLEMYCEKEAMESILRPIADRYHVYFGYNKGYDSASSIHETAERIETQMINGKTVVLLYLGDHDASGLDMVRDVEKRIKEFLMKWIITKGKTSYNEAECFVEEHFFIEHVALTKDQIDEYKPPANPAKFSDPRAKDYISKHGKISWELDSLEPEVLIQLTEDAILQYLNVDKYNAWIDIENKHKKKLKKFGDKLAEDDKKDDTEGRA